MNEDNKGQEQEIRIPVDCKQGHSSNFEWETLIEHGTIVPFQAS